MRLKNNAEPNGPLYYHSGVSTVYYKDWIRNVDSEDPNMAKVDTANGVTYSNEAYEHHEMKTNGGAAGTTKVVLERRMSEFYGATLSAHDINYSVDVGGTLCCGTKTEKQILNNVSAIFRPGLNAILGPSGSGKTSFLNVLADRLEKDRVKGHILLDGQPVPQNFKCMVGFVVQDDIVMGTLTVRENLTFSASLRLPSKVKKHERNQLVDDVIKELGLQHVADSKIGTPFIRGVSGGERKRCNVGMELIISPPVLFLDEPTSGLDANTANSVLVYLRSMADKGRTIIFSIHQPRYSIYKLFDTMLLLSKGQTAYYGPAMQALNFFEQQGYKCQQHNNPPDFFLDVINADQSTLVDVKKTNPNTGEQNKDTDPDKMHAEIVRGYQDSTWNKKLQEDAAALYAVSQNKTRRQNKYENVGFATSVFNQFLVVAGRSFRDLFRNPQTGLAVVGSSVFFALILIGIYWQLERKPKLSAYTDRGGIFFFMIMVQMFFNLGAMEAYVKEKVMYMHENVSGYYRASVYFMVKVFCDIIPLRLVAVFLMSVIVYFAAGLRDSEPKYFFLFVFALWLVSMLASSLCFLMAVTFDTFVVAQMLMALIYMMMMLFSGFLITFGSIGDWFGWCQYWSMVKYGLGALYINEFKDRVFCDDSGSCAGGSGNTHLEEKDIDYKDDFDFWVNYLALFLITVGLFVLSYIQLRRMKRKL